MNGKNIEIELGSLIESRVTESGIGISRICNFFNLPLKDIKEMYSQTTLDTDVVLKWSKLLEYDFFRLYSEHFFLNCDKTTKRYDEITTSLPIFRKKIYTEKSIAYLLNLIKKGERTKEEVMKEFDIPKATLYTWLNRKRK